MREKVHRTSGLDEVCALGFGNRFHIQGKKKTQKTELIYSSLVTVWSGSKLVQICAIMVWSDGAEVEELSETEFTHYADITGISNSVVRPPQCFWEHTGRI